MALLAQCFTLCALLGMGAIAVADVDYKIECRLDLGASTLEGTVEVHLDGADAPADDVLFLNRQFGRDRRLELSSAWVNGQPTEITAAGGSVAVAIPEGIRKRGELRIRIAFRMAAVPETEGVVLLEDHRSAGLAQSWYPRLLETASQRSGYSVVLTLLGGSLLASSADRQSGLSTGDGAVFELADANARSVVLVASPIFVGERIQVESCDIGLFLRDGSQRWLRHLRSTAAEIYDYYAGHVPGFARRRLDFVLGPETEESEQSSALVVILKDDLDRLAESFGGVFAANHLRWQVAVKLALAFWSDRIGHAPGSIPWLAEGLALHSAESYARRAMLGGPAFDNIRQFYINAAAAGLDTSLDQTVAQAEDAGLDWLPVLARSKGLWAVGMLRRAMGNSAFGNLLSRLATAAPEEALDNRRLQQLAEGEAGKDLSPLFEQWICGSASIDFRIADVSSSGGSAQVRIDSRGSWAPQAPVRIVFEDGSRRLLEASFDEGRAELRADSGGSPILRVEIDPERLLPDLNRSDNIRFFGSARRLDKLFAIDEVLYVGELIFTSKPSRTAAALESPFELTVTNRTDQPRFLGAWVTSRFPGGRNRGTVNILIELAPNETKTVLEILPFPDELTNRRLAEVRAQYFLVAGAEGFANLDRSSRSDLINFYIIEVLDR